MPESTDPSVPSSCGSDLTAATAGRPNCFTAASPGLLDQLVEGALGPLSRLRDTVDLTLDEVSDWIAQPQNRQQLTNLITLLDAQTQLLVCQQRLLAVARLVEVAAHAPGHETVRRACADLLRLRLIDPYREDKRPTPMPAPPDAASEAAILDALERFSRATAGDDGSPGDPPPPRRCRSGETRSDAQRDACGVSHNA